MKTIDRFVLKAYVGPMVLTFFIVMFVLLMNFMWRYIDELVGKGLDMGVIGELFLHGSVTLMPMGLPLATLLAAIMTLGNLGENYELLAMKSAGMSLPRILAPLVILVFFLSVGSFFVANNLVPYSYKEMYALLYDIKQQKQTIEFQDGLFFNGIDNMSIRVGHQDPNSKLLTEVLIYDNRNSNGIMSATVADSGYIRMSDDKKTLLVTLYNGESYEESRNYQWYDKNGLNRRVFTEQHMMVDLEGYDFSRTDSDLFTSNPSTKNIRELDRHIDSLEIVTTRNVTNSYDPLFRNHLFTMEKDMMVDTLRRESMRQHIYPILVDDSLAKMDVYERKRVWQTALNSAKNSTGIFESDEIMMKASLNELYRNKAEWHRKLSLPVSIMIFFLIGASLGAIIRKGGLGMPIVVSVIFFVIYYIISITGEKLAKEGSWNSFEGMWLSTFILLPLAIFLTYKATNDSNLFNAEWYIIRYRRVRDFVKGIFKSKKRKAYAKQ